MTPYVHAIRALTALVFRRLLVPAVIFVGICFLIIVIGIAVLAVKLTAWWLLGYLIVIPVAIVLLGLSGFGWLISERLMPRRLNREEKEQILGFVDKIVQIAEARATPLPIVGMIVAKDIVTRKKHGYIETLVNNTSGLKGDFQRIVAIFT